MAKTTVRKAQKPTRSLTPLGIIAGFVGLTEAVLGIGLTQVVGGVQVALTVFVIAFPCVIAGAFFLILWHRPFVFYSPAEYGDTDPGEYASAMRTGMLTDIAMQIESIEAQPADKDKQFALIDSLIEEPKRQLVILMNDKNAEMPLWSYISYVTGGDRSWSSGGVTGQDMLTKLNGTGLVAASVTTATIGLTDYGKEFANWLVKTGKRAAFLKTPMGDWGELKLPPGVPVPAGFPSPFPPATSKAADPPEGADPIANQPPTVEQRAGNETLTS
jgi:hypothetical protein